MAYERINWQNGEVGNTPLNANNLNRMDMTLEEHDQKIGDHDYEIENLKTGEQGITEELNKKMDRINPQGSGTFSIQAVNADNITAQTVEADEIKVAKVGSKGGTAPVVFDNDILVNGITTPIGSLASSASAKAESAERMAYEADRKAGTAKTTASTAYSRVQENIFRTDKLEGIVGGGVGESIPQYTYYDGKYLRPDGEIANYNDSARVIEFEINKNSDSGCNVIFKNVDLIPTDASILCGFYNAAGILLGEEMRGLIIMADFDEDTGKMTRQYISYCVVPAPYYAKYVRISGIANGAVDIAIQNTLSDAVAELQSRSTSALVLTNPSPLPATNGKKILGIDARGDSWQDGTPTPENAIPITDASNEVIAVKEFVYSGELLQGYWDASTGSFVSNANNVCSAEFIPCENNVSITYPKTLLRIAIAWYNGTTFIRRDNFDNTNKAEAEVPINATHFKFNINDSAPITPSNALAITVQSASNSVSLPFDPKSAGSAANEFIIYEDGTGKIIQRIGTRIYNGSEPRWNRHPTYNFYYIEEDDIEKTYQSGSNNRTYGLCDRFVYNTNNNPITQNNLMCSMYSPTLESKMRFACRLLDSDSIQTVAAFKTWLGSNPITLQYILATPIEKTLTAEEAAAVFQLMTYKGTTIIESEMNVKSVTYSGDVKTYVDSKTNYSYTDTIIGKWADDKDLHRRVIQTTTPSAENTDTEVATLPTGANVKRIDGTLIAGENTDAVNFYYGSTYYIATWVKSGKVRMRLSASYTSKPCEIVVEYTLNNETPAAASVMSLDETEE